MRPQSQHVLDGIASFQRNGSFPAYKVRPHLDHTELMHRLDMDFLQTECDLVLPDVNAVSRRASPLARARALGGGGGSGKSLTKTMHVMEGVH